MTEFPSTTEITVASSLLLLSYAPVFISPTRSHLTTNSFQNFQANYEKSRSRSVKISIVVVCDYRSRSVEESSWCEEGSLILGSNGSGSCGSALSSDRNNLGFEFSYAGDRFSLTNLKIARKRRSQVIWGSVCDLSTFSVDSKEESSCLSTGSSEVSTFASRMNLRKQRSYEKVRVEVKKKKENKNESSRSSSIRRRAKEILEFLSTGSSSSELQIRQVLGNTPDTSKALRMLLQMEEVKRYGTGGRHDPYIYKIA
ncbi:unnamed protein product [Eruca vesicaria subsp. sativa]|uniref:HTH three-helical bundle domain-containing protein n=1 Tax=Eruca vesicaria subsp. sativa TaxID=29727 RepID=A0ABC8LMT5_ERUVS|nr:unnamed protein product [Eruca vesicaria subsp. sativa]